MATEGPPVSGRDVESGGNIPRHEHRPLDRGLLPVDGAASARHLAARGPGANQGRAGGPAHAVQAGRRNAGAHRPRVVALALGGGAHPLAPLPIGEK